MRGPAAHTSLRATSSEPPYVNVSKPQCSGKACYGETAVQDLDLARRAKNLGLSIELTLLFDGGNSAGVPPAWAGDMQLSNLQSDLYAYVKAEILSYKRTGVMPDLVSIGNEVDTGFLGPIGSPTGANFGGFASLQTAAVRADQGHGVGTASAGPALPPLTCIHIMPACGTSRSSSRLQINFRFPTTRSARAITRSFTAFYRRAGRRQQSEQ